MLLLLFQCRITVTFYIPVSILFRLVLVTVILTSYVIDIATPSGFVGGTVTAISVAYLILLLFLILLLLLI